MPDDDEPTEDELLLEIDYTSYDSGCQDPIMTSGVGPVECRRLRGHKGAHATRSGTTAYIWSNE